MIPIIMPQVGQDIPTGTIVQWLKQENDPVREGEELLVVESEKASFEVEAEQSGILLKIIRREGEEVEILQPVGYIGQPGEKFDQRPADTAAEPQAAVPAAEQARQEQPAPATEATALPEKTLASPAVRRLAREKGVELAGIAGTGPGGRILKEDVLAKGPDEDTEDTIVPFGKIRKGIARRLTLSKQTIPHYYVFVDVDMMDALEWRRCYNAAHGTRITITDLIIKAAAVALRSFPQLNAHVDGQQIVLKKNINIGVAVSVDDGLLVPVIAEADQKSLTEISELSKRNAESARRGVMSAGPLGTFTISSLGMYSVKQFVPIINPPECTILAVASVEPRVVPVPGGIGTRDMMTLTLACDHRAVDGADAAGLLGEIKNNLERILDVQKQWV